MSKVRVYELAKDYGMKGPEMASLLRRLGFEKVKSHMAVLDEPDQMMVVALLEAQGHKKLSGSSGGSGGGGGLKKKKLAPPGLGSATGTAQDPAADGDSPKKSLPTPSARKEPTKQEPPKKKTLGEAAGEAAAPPKKSLGSPAGSGGSSEGRKAPDAPKKPIETSSAGARPDSTKTEATKTEATKTGPTKSEPTKPQPTAAQPAATKPTAAQPEAAKPAPAKSEPARPAAAQPESTKPEPGKTPARTAEKPAEAEPASAGSAATEAAKPEQPSTPEQTSAAAPPQAAPPQAAPPQQGQAATASAGAGAQKGAAAAAGGSKVKKLLVPQARATVVGRIELPESTIRDATRRSAPAGDRSAADRKLRHRALQSTQSRSASRGGPHMRRGPGPGGRGGGRKGVGRGGKSRGPSLQPTIDPDKLVELEPPVSLKGLSEALGVKVTQLIATLTFKLGVKGKTINSFLTPEEVELVALELGRNIKIVERKEAEEQLLADLVEKAADIDSYQRAPVLTFMGHVDHGKTSLLDKLRESDVVKGEAGGITQHIGAYKITHSSGAELVILDTPGHAAFTSMRARGASLTDIVVLVVAADDGVMPQTEEAINHAKAAKCPIVVAVNKCDKEGANPMQVRQQLAVKGLQPEEWGGDTQVVDVSAHTGQGLDDLVESIMLQAEILELKARPEAPGTGVVIESKQTPGEGVVINVLMTDGTIRVKDQALCGENLSRIRSMTDDHGKQVKEAGPATPVSIMGFSELPTPGDKLHVIQDAKKAKEVLADRQRRARDQALADRSAVTLETLSDALAAAKTAEIKVVLKADVMGSLEPIRQTLAELATEEVRVNIIHAALGGVTKTDVGLAEASEAIIIGFNSVPDQSARIDADRAGVEIRYYDVIYALIDDMKLALEGLLRPDEVESVIGHAEIRAIFRSSKLGNISGCYVLDGELKRNQHVRLTRDGRVVWTGKFAGLRRHSDDAREVKAGFECGVTLEKFDDVKVGDILECFQIDLVKRKLE